MNNQEFNSERQFIEYGENLAHVDNLMNNGLAINEQVNRVSNLQNRVDDFGENSSSSNEDENDDEAFNQAQSAVLMLQRHRTRAVTDVRRDQEGIMPDVSKTFRL